MNSSQRGTPEELVIETGNQQSGNHVHHEDVAMKVAAQYFGEELLPYLGITEKVQSVWPTEVIHLEVRQMYQDFNYLMTDGSLGHFEFESDSIRLEDMRRFREYEASTSRIYGLPVKTYVICSDKVKVLLSELTEGFNTYRVKVIRLKNQSADEFFAQLKEKKKLERNDYVGMVLTPLMSGDMPLKERILLCIEYLKTQTGELTADEVSKIQAMLYLLAEKFLGDEDFENVKEVLRVTRLGQAIYNDGVADGMEKGMEKGIQSLIRTCMNLGVSRENILSSLIQEYALDEEKAGEYVEKYGRA